MFAPCLSKTSPTVYFAKRFDSNDYLAITPAGKELFIFPHDSQILPLQAVPPPPVMINGLIRYLFKDGASSSPSYAYLDLHGKELPDSECFPSVAGISFAAVSPGRYIFSMTNADDGHFDPHYWANHDTNRIKWFGRLLKDYNLIGMSRAEVLSLLSKNIIRTSATTSANDEIIGYYLDSGFSIRIFFRDGKVFQWGLYQRGQDLAPYTTNVLLKESDKKNFDRLSEPIFVPK